MSADAEPGRRSAHADPAAQGARVLRYWRRVSRLPGGGRLFGFFVGRMAPYTGTISPTVLELEPGRARVEMRDRRRLRNHLRSLHAIALINLGELATGLALTTALPPGVRGIPIALSIEYHRKARGTVEAESACGAPVVTKETGPVEHEVVGAILDRSGQMVARVSARWRLERL